MFSTYRKIRHYVSIIRVCSANNKVRKGALGCQVYPSEMALLVRVAVGTNGFYIHFQAEKRSDSVQSDPHTGTLLRVPC